MTYKATISSKGQITIPIEARRKLGLKRRVVFEISENALIIRREPTLDEIRAVFNRLPKEKDVGLSDSERSNPMVQEIIRKHERTRGH